MREVYSTSIHSIGYEGGNLHVRWLKTGKTSVYYGVPEKLAEEVINASSVGSAVRQLQGSFDHGYEGNDGNRTG